MSKNEHIHHMTTRMKTLNKINFLE